MSKGKYPRSHNAMRCRSAYVHVALATALPLLANAGCGGARPYRLMARAATSEANVRTQVEDQRLKASMRQALLAHDPGEVLHVTPYVYMGHAYLVGFVDSPAQQQTVVAAVQGVEGVRSLDEYLPVRPASGSSAVDDATTKAAVKAALALDPSQVVTRIDLEVLDGHVVLLGIVDSQQTIDSAVAHAKDASGVTGVSNFLLLPEPEYERLRPSLR
jgi:osmotically-inducible protein OsmY